MPPRRSPLATLAMFYARASRRLRAAAALTAALSAAGKLLAVVIAVRVADADLHTAMLLGGAGFLVFAALRLVSNVARVEAECDLHRVLTRALLESDVLTEPTKRPLRTVLDLGFYARGLMTDTGPELAGCAIAAVAVAPLLATTLPARVLLVGGIVIVVVMAALVLLGRLSVSLQQRVSEAQERVFEHVEVAVGGRLEIVARGAEEATMRSLDAATHRYRGIAKKGAWTAALIGRAPLAAGLAAVVLVVVLDASYREAVTSAVLGRALVLAACLPILFGVALKANELTRLTAVVGPVLELLEAPRRAELARQGEPPPALPAAIVARDLSFSYSADARSTLTGVSFEWPTGNALVVEGRNGAGKSTLLRLLVGLRTPQSGSLTVGGAALSNLDLEAFRRQIAYLPQRPYLGELHSTVRSALRVVAEAEDDALTAALARVGLATGLSARRVDALDTAVGELSAGQRQRLALARVLLQDAAIYLLDEPDANLDRAGIALVAEIVRDLVARGRMVAIAAHTDELASLPGKHVTLS